MLAVVALGLITAIIAALDDDWHLVMVAVLMMIPTIAPWIVERWAGIHIPTNLQAQYAVLLLMGVYIGEILEMYFIWEPWDKVTHFYSGFAISFGTIFALGIILRRNNLSLPVWFEATLIIITKGFVAMLWEVGEFFWDIFWGTRVQDHNLDTMTDMMVGTLPGVFVAMALVRHRRKGSFSYIHSLLNDPQPSSLYRSTHFTG